VKWAASWEVEGSLGADMESKSRDSRKASSSDGERREFFIS
jgi:hypothetical protein